MVTESHQLKSMSIWDQSRLNKTRISQVQNQTDHSSESSLNKGLLFPFIFAGTKSKP
jgi:hypothetical protein